MATHCTVGTIFLISFGKSAAIWFGLEAKAAGAASQIIGYKKGSTAVHIFFCESKHKQGILLGFKELLKLAVVESKAMYFKQNFLG